MKKGDRPQTASSVAIAGSFPPGMCDRNEDSNNPKTVAPLETLVILAEPPPLWLLSRNMTSFQNDAVRFRFLCESLSVRNNAQVPKKSPRTSPTSPRARRQPATSSLVVDLASANAGTLLPHTDYGREEVKDSISPRVEVTVHKGRRISPERASNAGADLLAIRLQPAVPNSRGHTSPRHPRPMSGRSGSGSKPAMDGRLRRHIWSADRVLQWCSNFADDNDESGLKQQQEQEQHLLQQQQQRVKSAGGNRLGSAGGNRVSSPGTRALVEAEDRLGSAGRERQTSPGHVRSATERAKSSLERDGQRSGENKVGVGERLGSADGGPRVPSAGGERLGSASGRRVQSAGGRRVGSAERSEIGKAEATAVSRLELIMRSQYENTVDRDFCGVDFIQEMVWEGDADYVGAVSPIPKPPGPPITHSKHVVQLIKKERSAESHRERARTAETARLLEQQHLLYAQNKVKEVKEGEVHTEEYVHQWKANKVAKIKKELLLRQAEIKLGKEESLMQKHLETAEQVIKAQADRKRKKRVLKSKKNAMYVGSILNSMNRHAMKNETKHRDTAELERRKAQVNAVRLSENVKYMASEATPPIVPEEIKLPLDRSKHVATAPYASIAHINRLKEREESQERTTSTSSISPHHHSISVSRKPSDTTAGKLAPSASGLFNSLAEYMHASTSRSQFVSLPIEDGVSLEADLGSNIGTTSRYSSDNSVAIEFDNCIPEDAAVPVRKDITVTRRIDVIERMESADNSAFGSHFDLGSNPSTPARPKSQSNVPNRVRGQLSKSRIVMK
jgi:hypothetical protein